MMLPAPRKPTPVTTPWMMRVGSRLLPPNSRTACTVSSTNSVEPRHTSVCVRRPAGLRPICRSKPTTVPSTVETSMATRSCIHPPGMLVAPEQGRALLEEGLEPFVHVLARSEDPEQPALEPQPVVEPHLEPAVHGLEHRRDRERPVLENGQGELLGLGEQLLARHDPVHEPHALGLVGLDPAPREHDLE